MVVARRGYSSHQVQKYLELAPPPLGTHDLSALFPALRAEFTPLEEKSDRATLIAAFVALNLHTWLLDTAIVFTFTSIALILVVAIKIAQSTAMPIESPSLFTISVAIRTPFLFFCGEFVPESGSNPGGHWIE